MQHWKLNHFVVLKSASRTNIVIHDPSSGIKKLNYKEASDYFTGVVLELTPTNEFKITPPAPPLRLSNFWTKISGLKSSLLLIFTLSLLLQVFILISPYYIQLVVDNVILTGDSSLLSVLAIGFTLVLKFEVMTKSLRSYTLLHFGNLMNIQLGKNLFHHLIRLPLSYFEKRHMGDIVSRFASLAKIRELLTTGIIEALIDGLMALVTLAMMFFYSPSLTFVVITITVIYITFRFIMYRPYRSISEQELLAKAEENSGFMESIRAIQTIKLFSAEVNRESYWQNQYVNAVNQNIRLGYLNISYETVNDILFGLENIVVIFIAATLVIKGDFSTGMLFAFLAYKRQFTNKTYELIEKLIEFKVIGLHIERLADVVLTKKELMIEGTRKGIELKGKIAAENISFRYSDTTPAVIENLSFEILPGESVAITGPSGCGKSTLIKLLLGLESVDSGTVKVDEVPMSEIGSKQYRKQVAAVMQNDELISGSVADNISFFDNTINFDEVVRCAKIACIHKEISAMPMGYNSLIGDMGSTLSGGQKQRIILARALCKKPKVLFLDEATSHLDSELERKISKAIKGLEITRIIVAHRIETIATTDREIKL